MLCIYMHLLDCSLHFIVYMCSLWFIVSLCTQLSIIYQKLASGLILVCIFLSFLAHSFTKHSYFCLQLSFLLFPANFHLVPFLVTLGRGGREAREYSGH